MIIEHQQFSGTTVLEHQDVFTRPLEEGSFKQRIQPELAKFDIIEGSGVHFGVGGFRNLDIAAALRVKKILLADINKKQMAFWKLVDEVIVTSVSAKDFIQKLANEMFRLSEQYLVVTLYPSEFPIRKEEIDVSKRKEYKELETAIAKQEYNNISTEADGTLLFWLENEKNFQFIKNLFISGGVELINIDFLDQENFEKLRQWLMARNINVGSIYTSNLFYYFSRDYDYFDVNKSTNASQKMKNFVENLLKLSSSPDTLHVYTDYASDQRKYQLKFFDAIRENQIKLHPVCIIETAEKTADKILSGQAKLSKQLA